MTVSASLRKNLALMVRPALFVHSWICDERESSQLEDKKQVLERMPKVVYVQFYKYTSTGEKELPDWCLPGLTPGMYPIVPRKSDWFLDRSRKCPILKISRLQFPLVAATHAVRAWW